MVQATFTPRRTEEPFGSLTFNTRVLRPLGTPELEGSNQGNVSSVPKDNELEAERTWSPRKGSAPRIVRLWLLREHLTPVPAEASITPDISGRAR